MVLFKLADVTFKAHCGMESIVVSAEKLIREVKFIILPYTFVIAIDDFEV